MSLQNKQTELDGTKPDKLATAMLIIGIIIICSFVPYGIILFLAGGAWNLPPYISWILPFIILGGIGIVYGWRRTERGSSVSKLFVKDRLIRMRSGAIAGSATAFLVLQIAQMARAAQNGNQIFAARVSLFWENWVNGFIPSLFIDIPGALFFGISAGSIGGLILGSLWKNNKAAFIGGAIAGGITSFMYILILARSLSLNGNGGY